MRELNSRDERILLVEDEEPIRDLVQTALRFTGFTVESAAGGAEWLALRDEASRLLARERELAEVVQIVGLEGLPDSERAVLETARLLREGFLRQSAYSEVDSSCPPEKTLWMLRLFLAYARSAARRAAAGTSWKQLAGEGHGERLLRLCEVPPAGIEAVGVELLAAIEGKT